LSQFNSSISAFVEGATKLLQSRELSDTVWASVMSSSTHSAIHPPSPYERCSWRAFTALLPKPAAATVLTRVLDTYADASSCRALLCTRCGRRLTGAGALWPIRNTLESFLVHSDASKKKLLKELKVLLSVNSQQCQESKGKFARFEDHRLGDSKS
jgi:hypothetical protein